MVDGFPLYAGKSLENRRFIFVAAVLFLPLTECISFLRCQIRFRYWGVVVFIGGGFGVEG